MRSSVIDDNASPAPDCRVKVPPCRLWSSTSTRYPEALVMQLAVAFLRLEATPRARGRTE